MAQIEFKIPMLPPSMNSIYNILFSLRRVEMKPEVRRFKSQAKLYVPVFKVKKNQKVEIQIKVHRNWFCKNGNIKKADVQNLTKVIIDLIAEKMGFKDEQVWKETTEKIQSESEKVEVRLATLPSANKDSE